MTLAKMPYFFKSRLQQFQPDLIIFYPTYAFYLDVEVPSFKPEEKSVEQQTASSFQPRILEKTKREIKKNLPLWIQDRIRVWQVSRARKANPADWVWQSAPKGRIQRFQADL